MKYGKFVAIGMGISLCFSNGYIVHGWFSSESNVQNNSIILRNPEDGEGYYTRQVDTIDCDYPSISKYCGHSKFKFRFKWLKNSSEDPNGNRLWNENQIGQNKYPITIDNFEGIGPFSESTIDFNKDINKQDNYMIVNFKNKLDVQNLNKDFGKYFMTMRVGIGEDNEVQEYLKVGLRVRKKSGIMGYHNLEAQWDIISRIEVKKDVIPDLPPEINPEPTPEPDSPPEINPEPTPEPDLPPEINPEPTPEPDLPPEINPEPTPEPGLPPEINPEPTPEPDLPPEISPEPMPEPDLPPEISPEPTPEPDLPPEINPEPTPTPEPDLPQEISPEPTPEADLPPEISQELISESELVRFNSEIEKEMARLGVDYEIEEYIKLAGFNIEKILELINQEFNIEIKLD